MQRRTHNIPTITLRGRTVLPEMVTHIDLSSDSSRSLVDEAMRADRQIFLITQRDEETENPKQEELFAVGCVASVKQILRLPNDEYRVLVTGLYRAGLETLHEEGGKLRADVIELEDIDEFLELDPEEQQIDRDAAFLFLKELFLRYMEFQPKNYKTIEEELNKIRDFGKLVDVVAANFPAPYEKQQELLEEVSLMQRSATLYTAIYNEIQVQSLKEELQSKVKERIDRNQREYILREEVKQIREELGDNDMISDADEFAQELENLDAPDAVKEKIAREIKHFRNVGNSPGESGVIRTYIETMLDMPWNKTCKEHQDIDFARRVLDEDHYGLEKVKERILEFLAVRALTGKGDAPILCLVGPPGTGKTSIAKSLARALKKPYVRISLGGVRDEAEIRGHRKTYVGAMPGRIADAIRSAKVKNPLLLLDEIDKVSNDYKGDTYSALLEVLDSEQNSRFRDHYLEVPLDLSEVLFITTANTLQTIPRPLLDRMEVIEVSGYTENEKLHIAQEHLVPKQMERHGLNESQLSINKKAIWRMSRNYTKEAGVRQLERKIADICRKSAMRIFEQKCETVRVTGKNLESFLGKELYQYQMANKQNEIGIVRGLAWTSVGGDTLQIEVNVMPGEGEIILTGQLGDVMKESARTGISYIRSVGKDYGISDHYFKEHDIHIHIPEGAVPKDGPSAGITMATAILSAVTEKKVRSDIAMTGEITLRGRVLPIGGLKEKLLAAKAAGIRTVIVPKENIPDVKELSDEITRGLEIVPAAVMDEVIETAFAKE